MPADFPVSPSGGLVLVIDDCADIGQFLALAMKLEEIEACYAGSAAEAVRILGKHATAVIVLDDFMPETDGLEFLAYLRGDPRVQHIPVIFHSAGEVPARRVAAEKLGISAWVKKGGDAWPVLLGHIREQLALVQRRPPG